MAEDYIKCFISKSLCVKLPVKVRGRKEKEFDQVLMSKNSGSHKMWIIHLQWLKFMSLIILYFKIGFLNIFDILNCVIFVVGS